MLDVSECWLSNPLIKLESFTQYCLNETASAFDSWDVRNEYSYKLAQTFYMSMLSLKRKMPFIFITPFTPLGIGVQPSRFVVA